jgi:hypothetical protein
LHVEFSPCPTDVFLFTHTTFVVVVVVVVVVDLATHVQQGGDVRDVLRMYRGQNIPALYRERERMAIAKGGARASTFPSTLATILGGKGTGVEETKE